MVTEEEPVPPDFSFHTNLSKSSLNVNSAIAYVSSPVCGAIGLFLGVARKTSSTVPNKRNELFHKSAKVSRLIYEAYDDMCLTVFRKVIVEALLQWPEIHRVYLEHKLGPCELEEPGMIIAVSSPHRKAALSAVSYLVDEVKSRAPIWKKELFEDSDSSAAEWCENAEWNSTQEGPSRQVAHKTSLHEIHGSKLPCRRTSSDAQMDDAHRQRGRAAPSKKNEERRAIDGDVVADDTTEGSSNGSKIVTERYRPVVPAADDVNRVRIRDFEQKHEHCNPGATVMHEEFKKSEAKLKATEENSESGRPTAFRNLNEDRQKQYSPRNAINSLSKGKNLPESRASHSAELPSSTHLDCPPIDPENSEARAAQMEIESSSTGQKSGGRRSRRARNGAASIPVNHVLVDSPMLASEVFVDTPNGAKNSTAVDDNRTFIIEEEDVTSNQGGNNQEKDKQGDVKPTKQADEQLSFSKPLDSEQTASKQGNPLSAKQVPKQSNATRQTTFKHPPNKQSGIKKNVENQGDEPMSAIKQLSHSAQGGSSEKQLEQSIGGSSSDFKKAGIDKDDSRPKEVKEIITSRVEKRAELGPSEERMLTDTLNIIDDQQAGGTQQAASENTVLSTPDTRRPRAKRAARKRAGENNAVASETPIAEPSALESEKHPASVDCGSGEAQLVPINEPESSLTTQHIGKDESSTPIGLGELSPEAETPPTESTRKRGRQKKVRNVPLDSSLLQCSELSKTAVATSSEVPKESPEPEVVWDPNATVTAWGTLVAPPKAKNISKQTSDSSPSSAANTSAPNAVTIDQHIHSFLFGSPKFLYRNVERDLSVKLTCADFNKEGSMIAVTVQPSQTRPGNSAGNVERVCSLLSAAGNGGMLVRENVPARTLARLVGRGGRNMRAIETQYRCYVSLEISSIRALGMPEDIQQLSSYLDESLAAESNQQVVSGPITFGQIVLPRLSYRNFRANFITQLPSIQESTRTRISANLEDMASEGKLAIRGPRAGVDAAKSTLNDLIASLGSVVIAVPTEDVVRDLCARSRLPFSPRSPGSIQSPQASDSPSRAACNHFGFLCREHQLLCVGSLPNEPVENVAGIAVVVCGVLSSLEKCENDLRKLAARASWESITVPATAEQIRHLDPDIFRSIQETTGAEIVLGRGARVFVWGCEESRTQAARMLRDALANTGSTVPLKVSNMMALDLLYSGGELSPIRKAAASYNVKFDVVRRSLVLNISGVSTDVQAAKDELEAVMKSYEGYVTTTIMTTSGLVPNIIGKKGTTINDIQRTSGVSRMLVRTGDDAIQILQDRGEALTVEQIEGSSDAVNGVAAVVFVGHPSNVKVAEDLVRDHLKRFEDRRSQQLHSRSTNYGSPQVAQDAAKDPGLPNVDVVW